MAAEAAFKQGCHGQDMCVLAAHQENEFKLLVGDRFFLLSPLALATKKNMIHCQALLESEKGGRTAHRLVGGNS